MNGKILVKGLMMDILMYIDIGFRKDRGMNENGR